ncbi:SDR family NAD(P)-dependent oxidoreductase, partial [Anaerostipes hadrus]|uniref:SDR family NAD(P)-dependent oxidoreductase n=1 Tax=Anaerostipes hadrus TaxID=649756 RepID=UPI001ADDDD60
VDESYLMINTIFTSVITTCKNIVPHMLQYHEGKIINSSAIWGYAGASCEVLYSTTKGGINAFTMVLAKEVAASNIHVNAIAFGMIDTEMNAEFDEEDLS